MFKVGQIVVSNFYATSDKKLTVMVESFSSVDNSFVGVVLKNESKDKTLDPIGHKYKGFLPNWKLAEGEITLEQEPEFPFAVGDIVQSVNHTGCFVIRVTKIDTKGHCNFPTFAGLIIHTVNDKHDTASYYIGETRPAFIVANFEKVKLHTTVI